MVRLRVNGKPVVVEGLEPDTPLLWVLRDHLGMTGTRYGCGIGQCGSCSVHVDGVAARACLTPISALADREVTTIEGLQGAGADALREAWRRNAVPQCGFCQAGQLMNAADLLARKPQPDAAEVDAALEQNICRCGTYTRIRAAVLEAAKEMVAAVKEGAGR